MMDTQDLDVVLTKWGSQARTAAGHQPMPKFATRARRPRHFGWQFAVAVTAVAVAAAVVVGLPKLLAKDGNADPLHGITSTASAAPGFQVITYHGLSITVPASWLVTVGEPCQPDRSIVELPSWGSNMCTRDADPDVTIVELLGQAGPPASMEVTSTSHTTISGLPAIRTDGIRNGGEFPGRSAFSYSIPALQVVVQIMPASDQIARELDASLRVDAVDAHGCRSRVTEIATLPSHPVSHRSGLTEALLPGQPTSVSVCRYTSGWLEQRYTSSWLEQGAFLSGAAAQQLTATLDRLPTGLSRSNTPTLIQCAGHDDASPEGDYHDAFQFEARYPEGPPVVLIARLGWCGDLGISNGARTGQRTEDLVTALTGIFGATLVNGIPPDVTPAP
jgi:hypothetical protein